MIKVNTRFFLKILPIILVSVGVTTLLSCKKNKIQPPENLIPRDKMVRIIAEIQFTDAVLITAENQRKINNSEIPEYYSDLLHRFEITKEQFYSSLFFYSQDLEEFAKIYDDVLLILQDKQSQIKN